MSEAGRILLVTDSAFYPPYQGDSARLYALVRHFRSRGWHVSVVHFDDVTQETADYAAMARLCDDLHVYRPTAADLALRRSEAIDDWCPRAFAELVGRVAAANAVQVGVVQFVFFSRCLDALPTTVLRVLDADNAFSGRRALYAAAGLDYGWFSTTLDQELRGLRRADLLLAIQEAEQARLSALVPATPCLLVPHVHSAQTHPVSRAQTVLMVGAKNPENSDGVRRFVNQSWPVVRAALPASRLLLAGMTSHDIPPTPGVECLGIVPDLTSLYAASSVVINPVRCGTGLKIKTVEALCHGKALVSTPAGVQGLERYPGIYVTTAAPETFGPAVRSLLQDEVRRGWLEASARHFARQFFDPERVLGRLERTFIACLERRGRVDGISQSSGVVPASDGGAAPGGASDSLRAR